MLYSDYLKDKSHNAIKLNEVEGVPCILTHSKGKDLKNYEIYGNSYQATRSGKNLLPYPYVETTKTKNGVTFTVNEDGTIAASGTTTSNANLRLMNWTTFDKTKQYYITGCPTGGAWSKYSIYVSYWLNGTWVYEQAENGNGLLLNLPNMTKEFNQIQINCTVWSGATVSNIIFKPQLEVGTTATEYEQYGVMPSPDYPSEIQSVGDLVTDETSEYYGKYDVPVVIHGKNLFDTERWYNELYASETSHTGDYAISKTDEYIQLCAALGKLNLNFMEGEFETNTQYSISVQIMNVTANNTAGLLIKYTDGTVLDIRAFKTDTSWKDISVVTSKGKTISCIVINSYSPSTVFRIKNIQLEKGTTATSYEPYSGETKHIYLDEPLRKIGDYADYIDFENQKVVRFIKELICNGDGSIAWSIGNKMTNTISAQTRTKDAVHRIGELVCNKFTTKSSGISSIDEEFVQQAGLYLYVKVNKSRLSGETSADFNAWLAENNLKLYYPLATPTEEDLSLPNLKTLKGTCNISSETSISVSNIKAKYVRL